MAGRRSPNSLFAPHFPRRLTHRLRCSKDAVLDCRLRALRPHRRGRQAANPPAHQCAPERRSAGRHAEADRRPDALRSHATIASRGRLQRIADRMGWSRSVAARPLSLTVSGCSRQHVRLCRRLARCHQDVRLDRPVRCRRNLLYCDPRVLQCRSRPMLDAGRLHQLQPVLVVFSLQPGLSAGLQHG
jgi:hypothetical protein